MKYISIFLNLLTLANTQMLVGSQRDEHNCILDGGYQWCESLSQCIRPWETNCEIVEMNNIIPKNCATWNDGCNTCQVNQDGTLGACTLMYCFTQNTPSCTTYYRSENSCQSNSDCDENKFCRPTTTDYYGIKECVNYALENESCGGFILPNMLNICSPSLECVNTMGQMIADAPGICKLFCPNNERRDEYGNCITNGCQTWFDGCNSCQIGKNGIYIACSRMFCEIPQNAECRDNIILNELNEGDICYRSCEDFSQSFINRRNDCPSGTECLDSNTIGFDSCGERASICVRNGH